MTRQDIADALAREGVVETMLRKMTRSARLTDDLKDLAQMVYLIILDYPEDKLLDLWKSGHIRFFIARVIMNQLHGTRNAFYYAHRKFRAMTCPLIDEHDQIADNG